MRMLCFHPSQLVNYSGQCSVDRIFSSNRMNNDSMSRYQLFEIVGQLKLRQTHFCQRSPQEFGDYPFFSEQQNGGILPSKSVC
jgi:hypothetical protein